MINMNAMMIWLILGEWGHFWERHAHALILDDVLLDLYTHL